MITILPLTGIGEIPPQADLAGILAQACARLPAKPGDILVVTQKIISKSENRFRNLNDVTPSTEAWRLAEITRKDARLVELILRESAAIIRAAPHVLITRHHSGHVMANAGIDRSNLGTGQNNQVLLLPENPDASAAQLSTQLQKLHIPVTAIVIADSFGRPWRYGVVNVAIGAAGFPSLQDRRGQPDRDGRPLEITQIALADMVASAAGLAMGEGAESIPAAIIRGFLLPPESIPAASLVRAVEEDLFK